MKTIGFVGIGIMGGGMVQNLLRKKFNVIGYRKNKSKNTIKNKNFALADSLPELCRNSGIIITCLPSDLALKEVVFGDNGILENAKGKILIDCGTTSVALTEKIANECLKRKVDFLDAPMTGSKLAAQSGSIFFMVGGSRKLLEKCRPVLDAMGSRILYCGKNTYGQRAKIALNLGQALMMQSYIEALTLGIKNKVPLKIMMEILENSGAKSAVSTIKIQKIIRRDFSPHFKLGLMAKDVGFAMQEMKKMGISLELSKSLKGVFDDALKMCNSEDDFSCIVKVMEKNSGIAIKMHKP